MLSMGLTLTLDDFKQVARGNCQSATAEMIYCGMPQVHTEDGTVS